MRMIRGFRMADAILTGDIEIRSFQPTCRTDDHWEAQQKKFNWLNELQQKHDCPIFDSGDLFDKKYKTHPSHSLIGWAMENLPSPFYTIPGNHDLPGKSIDNYDNSAMAVLEKAKKLIDCLPKEFINLGENFLYGFPWDTEIKEPTIINDHNVALIHTMVYEEFEPFPGCEGYSALELLKLLPNFKLIVTGHNHQCFVKEYKGRILVNPGSFMRNDADQIDHEPSVFLWFADENEVERVRIPIESGVISREHIDIKNEKSKRLDAFVEKLGEQALTGINFHDNLQAAVSENDIGKSVKDKIWSYYEGL